MKKLLIEAQAKITEYQSKIENENKKKLAEAQAKITEYKHKIENEIKKRLAEVQQQELTRAIELAANNNFDKAITTLEKIPATSALYREAQAKVIEYRRKYQQQELEKAIELADNSSFEKAIVILKNISANSELYREAQAKITEYQSKIENEKKRKLAEAQQQELTRAIELAANNNFDKAITTLEKIPATSALYREAQAKVIEYRRKYQQQELEKAIELADNSSFEKAIVILKNISANSELYREAQAKITEYRSKIENEKKRKLAEAQQQELEKAIELADNRNFEKAIATLEKIPASSELYQEVQVRVTEYRKRYQRQELAKAIELGDNSNFEKAIATLERIPVSSELYTEAQARVTEYKHKIENEKKRKLLEAQQHDLNTAINLANINKFEEAIINLAKIPVSSELYQQAQAKITEYQQKIEEERKKRQAEAGGRAIEVVEIFEQNGLSTRNSICESIDGRMIVVMMDLSNTSKKTGNFLYSKFELIDSNQCTYIELSDMTYRIWRQEKGFGLRSDDYFPGEIRQDAAIFRVSPTAKDFTLKWNGKTIKLWL